MEAVGKELAVLRERRGVTQEDVAHAVGLSRAGYQLYETGRREVPLGVLLRVVAFLGGDVRSLLGAAEENHPHAFDITWGEDVQGPEQ